MIGGGEVFRWLLTLPTVREIDLPPEIDAEVGPLLDAGIRDLDVVEDPDDAPLMGIVDSGVNEAHPLLAPVVVERLSSPASLGLSDGYGHGTKVSE